MATDASKLARRLEALGQITDEPGGLTRTFLSPAMQRANAQVSVWMREAGLTVQTDTLGNLIGTTAPAGLPRTPTLLLGSHLDTVRNAGKFDGALGVLLPLTALEILRRRGVVLPFAVEVIGFSEEEGVRFGAAYLGSEGFTGRLRASTLALRDNTGESLADTLKRFNAGTFALPAARHHRRDLLGYVETHLEQGPVLEAAGLATGVVSTIAGQSRFHFTWTGQAGHAGTTPMALRRDAFAGAAEFTLAVEALARGTQGLVATVGVCRLQPGAANVIPGRAEHSLDVRHAQDRVRRAAVRELVSLAHSIAQRRGLRVVPRRMQDHAATPCSTVLSAALARSVKAVQGRSPSLVSGAGHDAVVLAQLTSVAMLFVRCRDGLSHHPREHVSTADLGVALRVLVDFLQQLGRQTTPKHMQVRPRSRGRSRGAI